MNEINPQAADIGHNNPPTLREELLAANADLEKRVCDLSESAGRVPDITDQDTAEKAANLIAMIGKAKSATEKSRKEAKQPYLDAGKEVDGFFKPYVDTLDAAKKQATSKLTAYQVDLQRKQREAEEAERRRLAEEQRQREEEARKAAEEGNAIRAAQERAAAEEAAKLAAAAPKRVKTKSDWGATGSLRTVRKVRIIDATKIPQDFLINWLDMDAIQKAANRALKAEKADGVPGLQVYDDNQSVVRS